MSTFSKSLIEKMSTGNRLSIEDDAEIVGALEFGIIRSLGVRG